MQPIKDKAREYAEDVQMNEHLDTVPAVEILIDIYLAGAKEAMRWRNAKNEPPTDTGEVVILTERHTRIVGYRNDIGNWKDGNGNHVDAIEWKPIELETE